MVRSGLKDNRLTSLQTDVRLLPEHVASLFKPRPPLKYVEPVDTDPAKRCTRRIDGLAGYFSQLLDQPDEVPYTPTESVQQRRHREKQEKQRENQRLLEERSKNWDPKKDLHVRGDPYNTLFVARLSYKTTEDDLRKHFGKFGPIERVRVVKDANEKSKGYAFVVFELQRDMNVARREMQHSTIHGWRVLCDVERGRTDLKFKPRSLGGGLGGRRVRVVDAPPPREHAPPALRGVKRDRNGDFRDERRDERRNGDQRPPPPAPRFRDRPREDSRDRARREERDRDRAARERERERAHTRDRERDRSDKHHRRDDTSTRDDRHRGDDSHREERDRERARRDRERRDRDSQRERHGDRRRH